jgi:predicted Zn-dependent protease
MEFLNNLSRRKFVYGSFCSICGSLFLPSCAEVPLTKRKQFNFHSYNMPIVILDDIYGFPIPKIYANENSLNKECEKDYRKFISKAREKNVLIENTQDSKRIKEIGIEISQSIQKHYETKNESNPVKNFNWEFELLDEKDRQGNLIKNAWCMPGGKVAFFTGILPIANNDDGIAAIMGHEIAHAFARHGIESLTRYSMIQMGSLALASSEHAELLKKSVNLLGNNINIYDSILNYGVLLPFSRTMESEADYMGLAFMNLSGFNMKESIEIWKRMQSANTRGDAPEFMSTHPSPKNRILKINEWISEVSTKFPPVNV